MQDDLLRSWLRARCSVTGILEALLGFRDCSGRAALVCASFDVKRYEEMSCSLRSSGQSALDVSWTAPSCARLLLTMTANASEVRVELVLPLFVVLLKFYDLR
eukprot:TRINITY_DN35400_c0_g1_i1.p1 TRINITY_DN35400_c0_g1~~TRINITY_DN35400_c0_g1_i1.p1  ORF type:complete len:103 (-),score=3.56 TRINITY_DN35400_c0_g1_i1:73-381(-)